METILENEAWPYAVPEGQTLIAKKQKYQALAMKLTSHDHHPDFTKVESKPDSYSSS